LLGCTDLIQKAISQPTDENKDRCWRALLPTAETLKDFYLHSEKLGEVLPLLIDTLFTTDDFNASLGTKQALTKQLAAIIDFAMYYDDYKMVNPAISNDFSYYRRSMSGPYSCGCYPFCLVSAPSRHEAARWRYQVPHHGRACQQDVTLLCLPDAYAQRGDAGGEE